MVQGIDIMADRLLPDVSEREITDIVAADLEVDAEIIMPSALLLQREGPDRRSCDIA